jgi:inosine-uridine nucleoside N-ribohydrolase
MNNEQLDLTGICCVYGNAPLPDVERVAREIVALKKSSVPVLRGAAEPLSGSPNSNPAVEFMADALREHPLSIAAIGPLTNIGMLVQAYPEVVRNISELIVVAGRSAGAEFFIGDSGPVRDFNFENDPLAAELILAADIPLVLMGFELTSQVSVTRADLATIRARGDDTARYFYENSVAWCDHWTKTFPQDPGFHPWDSAAIAWLTHRDWFQQQARGCRITRDPPLFECDPTFPGTKHTYCTGFADGAKQAFVAQVVSEIW